MSFRPGACVGEYQIVEQLGVGGCGAVFRGRHRRSGAEVALKTLLPGAQTDDRLRFQREGEAMARLRHPNLLRVHGLAEHDGQPVLIMELAESSLADRLRSGPLPWAQAVDVTAGLAAGLAEAHRAGILHRDLKPENVLFGSDGLPKLADFGLARLDDRSRLTKTGAVLGTPSYMPPEQISGNASPASDLYALAAILFTCIAGRPPLSIAGSLIQVLVRVQQEPAPRLRSFAPEVPAAIDALVAEALAKDPQSRPTLEAFRQRLTALTDDAHKPQLGAFALGAVVLAVASLVAVGLVLRQGEPQPEPTPTQPQATTPPEPDPPAVRIPVEVVEAQESIQAALDAHGSTAFVQLPWATLGRDTDALDANSWESYAAIHDPDTSKSARAAHRLRLARQGHVRPLLALLNSEPMNAGTKAILRCLASLGDDKAFQKLDRFRLPERGTEGPEREERLRRCYRYLAYASQIDVAHPGIKSDLGKRQVNFVHPGQAWVALWGLEEAEPPSNGDWLRAREALARGAAYAAVEAYRDTLRSLPAGAQRSAVLAELRRAAELAWGPELVAAGAQLARGYALPKPLLLDAQTLLEQADAVLQTTRWSRGHLLRALLRLEASRQRGLRELGPVVADLCAAIQLSPDFAHAHSVLAQLAITSNPLLALRVTERQIAFRNPSAVMRERAARAVYLGRVQRMLPGVVRAEEHRAALRALVHSPDWDPKYEKYLRALQQRDAGRAGSTRRVLERLMRRVPEWNRPPLTEDAAKFDQGGPRGRPAYTALRKSNAQRDPEHARSAALSLARRGHLRGLLELVLRSKLDHGLALELLWELAVLGEPLALSAIGARLEIAAAGLAADHPQRRLATAFRTAGLSAELGGLTRGHALRLAERGLLATFPRPELAYLEVWSAKHGDPDRERPEWRAARKALRAGKLTRAIEHYVAALERPQRSEDRVRLRRELRLTATQHWAEQAALHATDLAGGYAREHATALPLKEVLAQADPILARWGWASGFALRAVLRWSAIRESSSPDYDVVEDDLNRAVSLRPDLIFAYQHWNRLNPSASASQRLDRIREFFALTSYGDRRAATSHLELAWAKRQVHHLKPHGDIGAKECLEAEAKLSEEKDPWSDVDRARLDELRGWRKACQEGHPRCAYDYRDD